MRIFGNQRIWEIKNKKVYILELSDKLDEAQELLKINMLEG